MIKIFSKPVGVGASTTQSNREHQGAPIPKTRREAMPLDRKLKMCYNYVIKNLGANENEAYKGTTV